MAARAVSVRARRGESAGLGRNFRASIPASEIEEVRDRTLAVSMRFDEAPWSRIDRSTIAREAPQATHTLPSPALSSANGGPFTMDPQAKEKDVMLDSIFVIDIAADPDLTSEHWGERLWVRFDHGASPVISRLYRMARQLFLGRFHV